MRALCVRAALLAVFLPVGVCAQTVSLTESQVLALLSAEAPRVSAARAPIALAAADVLAAGRWPDPRVTFNREAVAGTTENMLMVSQPLPVSGRRRLDVSAAGARVAATTSRAEEQVRRVRADLRRAFTALWAAQTSERELVRGRDRLQELATVLERREAAGDAAGFDRLRAEREVIEADVDRANAALVRIRAQAMLVAFFASPPGDPALVEVVRTEGTPPAIPSVEDLAARAARARGDVSALQHDLEAAGFAEQSAGRRRIPEPEVVAGTKSSNAGGGDIGSLVSVHVTVPLFDRGRAERAAAQARASQARAEAAVLDGVVRAEIVAWRAAVLARRDIAERYRGAVTATAEQLERIALVSYDAGERGILDLLDAIRTASSARVRQVALDAAVRDAEIELELVSGWELP